MPEIYQVSNIEEAVELAYKFKDEGKYDWFRGQAVDYVPHSSLFRRQLTGNTQVAANQYNLFTAWISKIDELKYLLDPANVHELEAIMQHYGIPTHYIDFTTDPGVAGFFAADVKQPPTERNSCIYCLNTEDLFSTWDVIKTFDSRKGCQLEKITLNVDNLWRLQAQYGVFLLCNYNLEIDYSLDMISFPYTGYPSYPTKDIIYPHHKGSLELLLDQYFDMSRTNDTWEILKDVTLPIEWEEFPGGYHAKAFNDTSLIKTLHSWKNRENVWRAYKTENYHTTTGTKEKLRLNNLESPEALRKAIGFGIKQLLRSKSSIRNYTIDWHFEEAPKNLNTDGLTGMLNKIWNGMRILPFENDEIGDACGNAVYLSVKSGGLLPDREKELEIFSGLFGKSMRVGFSNADNTGSYGYASLQSIAEATEINLAEWVSGEFTELVGDIRERFKIMYNPQLMFEFDKFKNFFAREVIPSQVAWDQSLVIYNPHKLKIFGIP